MELIKNTIFDENMLYEDIIHCTDLMMKQIAGSEDAKIKEKYVSKMYSNAFANLLRNGMICGKEETDNSVYYCMNINDYIYRCEESILKNVLFKDFDSVIASALHE